MSRKKNSPMKKIKRAFDEEVLATVCELPERQFAQAYGMTTEQVVTKYARSWAPLDEDYYHFKDNGSNVLAVAHLDTVMPDDRRAARFIDTEAGKVVYSGALDDRLGAYVILELLPELGVTYDWLLTVGEESGCSTAEHFVPMKDYDWVIEFDRGGTDVVMYQFEDSETRDLVKATGARVGEGIFSDICYLEHLGVKAFNWGVGYRDYHGARSHAYLEDTFQMVNHYLRFHENNVGTTLVHEDEETWWERYKQSQNRSWEWDDPDEDDPDKIAEAEIVEALEDKPWFLDDTENRTA